MVIKVPNGSNGCHSIIEFIRCLRETDPYISVIYLNGGCYIFYLLLKSLYPDAQPVMSIDEDHVGALIDGAVYDIQGLAKWNYKCMDGDMIKIAQKWSFSKKAMIQLGECPICEEPLVF